MNATRKKILDAIDSCVESEFVQETLSTGGAPPALLALAFLCGYLKKEEPEIASALEKLRKVVQ